MPNRSERDLLQAMREQLRRCHGFEGDKISEDRHSAYRYYFQRPRGDEVAGASQVVSGDLSSMVEATLAQMMDAYSGDAIAEFHADGPDDEDQAKLESAVVQQIVMRQNNGYLQFLQTIKDGLLLRNGFMRVWYDVKEKSSRASFENVESDALPSFQAPQPGVETELLRYDPEKKTLDVRFIHRTARLRVESLAPENFLYLDSWDSHDLQDIPFCAERHVDSRSDLIRRGFPRRVVDKLPAHHPQPGATTLARRPAEHMSPANAPDKSQDLIEWFECYALLDQDGDGISERRRVSIAGAHQDTLLENVPVSIVPYAAGSALINPHTLTGISLYDKLRQKQDLSTGLERALMDNVESVNRRRLAYLDGMVNTDDLDNGRPSGSLRVRKSVGDIQRAIMAIEVPDMSSGLLQNLQYQRQTRAELGGAALDLATGQMQLNDRLGSMGLDRAYSVMEQLAGLMTRTMAMTLIRSVFLLAHATLRANVNAPVSIKRGGRWIEDTPSGWQERTDLIIKVGMSPGERGRRADALHRLIELQVAFAEKGMDEILVNLDNHYTLVMDWCRALDIPNPEQYFVDPRSPQSKRAAQQKQAEADKQEQAKQAFLQQAVQLEQMRTAMDKYRQDTELQFKYWAETLRAEIAEAQIVGNATTTLLKGKQDGQKSNGKKPAGESASK